MTDVPGFEPIARPEGDGSFTELKGVLNDAAVFVPNTLEQITDLADAPTELRDAVRATQQAIPPAIRRLVAEVESGLYDTALRRHSLGDDDPAWRLKYVGYRLSRARVEQRARESRLSGQEGVRSYLRWSRRPLQWLNVILGSLSEAIPVAGGVAKELKESGEAAIDEALDES